MRKYLIVLVATLLFGCQYIKEETSNCPALSLPEVSYSIHVYPIVNKTCAIPQCHSTNFEHGNFNRFDDIKKKADSGKLIFMIETHQMPHGFTDGPFYLTTCEIETIKKWVREGANNN